MKFAKLRAREEDMDHGILWQGLNLKESKLVSIHNPRTNPGVLRKCPTWNIIPGPHLYVVSMKDISI